MYRNLSQWHCWKDILITCRADVQVQECFRYGQSKPYLTLWIIRLLKHVFYSMDVYIQASIMYNRLTGLYWRLTVRRMVKNGHNSRVLMDQQLHPKENACWASEWLFLSTKQATHFATCLTPRFSTYLSVWSKHSPVGKHMVGE